jgi:predicted CXXCH cytochrome family protein
MKGWTAVACVSVVVVLSMGCNATSRYQVLSFFFDGVPTPVAPGAAEGEQAAIAATAVQPRQVGYREHGPYAARLCNACHESGASNALLVAREQLCFKCHELGLDKKYIHGPLASGGCLACHDPHSSQYRYFLVSESDSFCSHCHERQAIETVGAHAGSIEEKCTTCHDPHMSDKKYLLR